MECILFHYFYKMKIYLFWYALKSQGVQDVIEAAVSRVPSILKALMYLSEVQAEELLVKYSWHDPLSVG